MKLGQNIVTPDKPEHITEIHPLAFQGCENLRHAVIPEHLRDQMDRFPPCTEVRCYVPGKNF